MLGEVGQTGGGGACMGQAGGGGVCMSRCLREGVAVRAWVDGSDRQFFS